MRTHGTRLILLVDDHAGVRHGLALLAAVAAMTPAARARSVDQLFLTQCQTGLFTRSRYRRTAASCWEAISL